MLQTFITAFQLKNTYRVNSIIYSIRGIPFIKKILPYNLYENSGLKALGTVFSILIEIGSAFLGKLLYLFFMIYLMTFVYKGNQSDIFLHLFIFLTLVGGLMNTYMFNPTKDKYYAMVLMNMNAQEYALSNYYYAMLKVFIGFLPFTILFGLLANIPLWISLLLPIFVVMVKFIVIYYNIYYFEKTGIANNENLPTKGLYILIAIILAAAYGLPFLGIVINKVVFLVLFAVSLIIGIISFLKIKNYQYYNKLYKQLLTPNNVYATQKATSTQVIKENAAKQIEYEGNFTSNKSGFAYFHDLFVKRHRKILTKAVKKQALVITCILGVLVLVIMIYPEVRPQLNTIPLTYLPYFVFIMYILNMGTTVTQAMFMNCDHSMLTYRIYRTPKVILGVFRERLKTLITINLLPASVIAIGLPLILYLTGGTDNVFNYVILFTSIIAMSIFFSVHYLVMYYLLQPYNIETELKNSTYKLVQGITYFVCYIMIQLKLPTFPFGLAIIVFSIVYSLVSLVLVYKWAPKTFRIRLG